jgi:hypothetical protein
MAWPLTLWMRKSPADEAGLFCQRKAELRNATHTQVMASVTRPLVDALGSFLNGATALTPK